jgi:hypothetical protein
MIRIEYWPKRPEQRIDLTLRNRTIEFVRNELGHLVCECDEDSASLLLCVPEAYRLYGDSIIPESEIGEAIIREQEAIQEMAVEQVEPDVAGDDVVVDMGDGNMANLSRMSVDELRAFHMQFVGKLPPGRFSAERLIAMIEGSNEVIE